MKKNFIAGLEPSSYEEMFKNSYVYKELHSCRNIRPSFNSRFGFYGGILYTGAVWYFTRGKEPWTFSHHGKEGMIYKYKYNVIPLIAGLWLPGVHLVMRVQLS